MTIATGVAKELRYKREASWAVLPGASSAQVLRRVQSTLDLAKQTYQSNEIRKDRQISDFRHGVRSVAGGVNGELSPGTYADFFRAAMRQAFQTAVTTGTATDIVAGTAAPQFTRTTGNFLTNGFKVGDMVSWSGWTTTGTANNSRNFLIATLVGTAMGGSFMDGTTVAAKGTGDSVVCVQRGKKTWVPSTAQLDESFTFEHWFSDVNQSERYTGCKLSEMGIALPPTGIATIGMQFMGCDRATGTAEYFTSPTGETTTGLVAAVNGLILVNGTAVGTLTGLSATVREGLSMEPVVGSNTYPAIFQGRFTAGGQLTAFFEDGTLRDAFDNESEVSIVAAMMASEAALADFNVFVFPRVKLGGAPKDDGEKGIVQTIPFQALLNTAGGTAQNSLLTTMSVQDSQAT